MKENSMKAIKLLTTTAIIAGTFAVMSSAQAADQGWFESMKQSVQTWFAPKDSENQNVETYLDEVTIAVPPMTGDEASQIEPAAGLGRR